MVKHQNAIGCLVMNATSGRIGKAVMSRIDRFSQVNGLEWTARRYKAIYQAALLKRQGRLSEVLQVYRNNSISYNPKTLNPSGPEGILVHNFVTAQRPSAIKRAAGALRVYTVLRLNKPSRSQVHKTKKSINSPYSGVIGLDKLRQLGRDHMTLALMYKHVRVKTLEEMPLTIRERDGSNLSPGKYYYSRYKVPSQIRRGPYSSMAMSFLTESYIPPQLDWVTPAYEGRKLLKEDPFLNHSKDNILGRITYIQELGCKGRVVCMPSAPLQLAFRPLQKRLSMITSRVFTESKVLDQVSGAHIIENHVIQGRKVYCSDLSSATDRFPLEYQLGVLDAIGYTPYANALKDVITNGRFIDAHTGEYHRYSVGQPMGLYGSFPLFNLAHCALVYACYQDCLHHNTVTDTFSNGEAFMIVGDDVVFACPVLKETYDRLLKDMGVEVQVEKSHNYPVAEFVGFLAVGSNRSKRPVVFRPLKFSDTGFPSALSLLDTIGSKSSNLGSTPSKSRWWKKQFDIFSRTSVYRRLDLSSYIEFSHDEVRINTFRGGDTDFKNVMQTIYLLSDKQLPDFDLVTKGKVNRIPLFSERGPWDLYGYNAEMLITALQDEIHPMRKVNKSLHDDPLMREIDTIQQVSVTQSPQEQVSPVLVDEGYIDGYDDFGL